MQHTGRQTACSRSDVAPGRPERGGERLVITLGRPWRCHRAVRGSGSGRYVFEHVLVINEILGQCLLPGESVHHRNGLQGDNRREHDL
jgi:hypothetical protein